MSSKKHLLQIFFYVMQIEYLTQVYIRQVKRPDREILEWLEQQRLRVYKHCIALKEHVPEKVVRHVRMMLRRMDKAAFRARVTFINKDISDAKKEAWLNRQIRTPTSIFTIKK